MDGENFAKLVRTEHAGLSVYFGRRGVPQCDREEMVQESLMLLWERREHILPGKERPYLYGVAHRLLMAYHRKQGLGRVVLVAGLPEDVIEAPPAHGGAFRFMALLAQEAVEGLHRLLGQLPARQREVIQSIYFEGRSLSQTAEDLHIGKNTVATHHRRALERLRERLGAEDCG